MRESARCRGADKLIRSGKLRDVQFLFDDLNVEFVEIANEERAP
jgi:hypothetical protein